MGQDPGAAAERGRSRCTWKACRRAADQGRYPLPCIRARYHAWFISMTECKVGRVCKEVPPLPPPVTPLYRQFNAPRVTTLIAFQLSLLRLRVQARPPLPQPLMFLDLQSKHWALMFRVSEPMPPVVTCSNNYPVGVFVKCTAVRL